MNTISVRRWLGCIALGLSIAVPAVADEEVAALIVDNGNVMHGLVSNRLCIAGFPSDPTPTRCSAPNGVTSNSSPSVSTQNILTTDSCGSMDVNTFFNHRFDLLKLRGKNGLLSCKQEGTALALAFKFADRNRDGLLSEDEFNVFRNTWGMVR